MSPLEGRPVVVIGAGVAGLTAAMALVKRGAHVTVFERSQAIGQDACSWMAGGMLAPDCEREAGGDLVGERGRRALTWWPDHASCVCQQGSLVVAASHDRAELQHFALRTRGHRLVDNGVIEQLEPDLSGRFDEGLWFANEAHLDPRKALPQLAQALRERGVAITLGQEASAAQFTEELVVDCRGMSARGDLPELRGVRGEMLVLHSNDVRFNRPVRLLHPRIPLYVVPRENGLLMLGATSIESDHAGPVTVRSAIELLRAAHALHPALAEAEIVELGVGVRPAFPDHLPRLRRERNRIHFNGLYRHGFLLAPWYAERLAAMGTESVETT